MKTTVVVATYNGEKYIYKQLLSIVRQSVVPNQIVVTDDGSIDKTLEIVEKFANKYINIEWSIVKNKHQGFIFNYISGIEKAKHQFIFLADQDDDWKKEKIKKYLEIYEQKKALLIHGEIDVVNLNNDVIVRNSQGYKNGYEVLSFQQFLNKPNYPGMSLSFRKDFFEKYKNFFYQHKEEIKTHDFIFVMLAVLNDGAYLIGPALNNRTFTGENVAMNSEPATTINYGRRIEATKIYIEQVKILKQTIQGYKLHTSDLKLVQNMLSFQEKRLTFLDKKTLKNGLKYTVTIRSIANVKTYVGDIISIFKK